MKKNQPMHRRLLGAALRAARKRAGIRRVDAIGAMGLCKRAFDGHERGETAAPIEDYLELYGTDARALLAEAAKIEIPEG